jgi:hypothetical protein
MKRIVIAALLAGAVTGLAATNAPFTGRIQATLTRGGEVQTFITTAGTNCVRIERGETDRPYARNLIDRATGEVTLLFPHNRSYTRLPNHQDPNAEVPPGRPAGLPPQGFPPPGGMPTPPTVAPAGIGPANLPPGAPPPPAMPQMPQMPQMPAMGGGMPMMPPMDMMEKAGLNATGQKTNLLGYTCEKYEIRQRGEVMEIWATDALMPFQPWLSTQPHRFGPRQIEEQWSELLKARKLFPLRASLKFGNDTERLCFEVKSITTGKIEDRDGALFQPPPDYHKLEPMPF